MADSREAFVADLLSVYENYGSWRIIPLDIITAQQSIILRVITESQNFGTNTAIVILRYNSDNLIDEIIEVFSPVQEGYNFN